MGSNLSLTDHETTLAIAVHAWLSGAKDEKDLTKRLKTLTEQTEPLKTWDQLSRKLSQKLWEGLGE